MKYLLPIIAAALLAASAASAEASDRYTSRPPLVVSPDLSAPWVMQLRRAPQGARIDGLRGARMVPAREPVVRRQRRQVAAPAPQPVARYQRRQIALPTPQPAQRQAQPDRGVQTAAVAAAARAHPQMNPKFLPTTVNYDGPHKPGTIVIDTSTKYLYLVQDDGQARRYGVGVGKDGFLWHGTENIAQKKEWPGWTPPSEMIAREKKKGRILPAHMDGGPANPLGARALYLGSTLYRIHGTNAPWTIGGNVSSGCIRMRNEDVMDLYDRVKVGTKVVVI